MARKGINIAVASDTRQFASGVAKGVVEPLEDVAEALENVTDESKQAGKTLEDEMRDAQRATKRVSEEAKDLHDVIERGSRSSFRKMADSAKDASRDAEDAVSEFKDEAKQNLSEVASSFTGDMDSAVDLVQGTLGGLVSSIPGIGLALAPLAGAAGAFYAGWQESTEKAKQRVADMYDDMLASGERFLTEDYKQQEYWKIIRNESDVLTRKKAEEYATMAGLTYEQVAMAFAGSVEQMELLQERLSAKREEYYQRMLAASGEERVALSEQMTWYEEILDATERRNAEIERTVTEVNRARDAFNAWGREIQAAGNQSSDAYNKARTGIAAVVAEAKALPTDIRVKITPDTSGLVSAIRNTLSKEQFTVYANARTVGRPVL